MAHEKLIEDIANFKVHSSTDVGMSIFKAAEDLLRGESDVRAALREVAVLIRKVHTVRPTSIMITNFARRLLRRADELLNSGMASGEIAQNLVLEIQRIREDIEKAVHVAATLCARRIEEGETIMTCSYSQTVLEVFQLAKRDKRFNVIVTESRPGGEGVLLAERLEKAGVDVTLIVDSAVRYFMKDVDKVIVGADAIAANGAVVNKVGTSLIALAAHEARVRFYVAAETYKFSPATFLGELVVIEERDATEVVPRQLLGRLGRVKVRNPAFDVTPPEYIDAIITEKGLIPPKASILILEEEYGRTLEEELTKLTLDIDDSEYVAVS